jgi:hypothetical protein
MSPHLSHLLTNHQALQALRCFRTPSLPLRFSSCLWKNLQGLWSHHTLCPNLEAGKHESWNQYDKDQGLSIDSHP